MNFRRMAQIEDRIIASYEKRYAKAIRRALIEQSEHFLKHGDINNALYPVISELYDEVMTFFLQRQWKQLEGETVKAGFFLSEWLIWIQVFKDANLAKEVADIGDTTRERLRHILERATAEGLEFEVIAQRIKNGGIASVKRALMIARTETANAVNISKTKSADDWERDSGREIGKIWIHRGAKDPRDWHLSLDNGTMIRKEETWSVTDPNTGKTDHMKHPHDLNASAGNVINCGCQVLYKRWK